MSVLVIFDSQCKHTERIAQAISRALNGTHQVRAIDVIQAEGLDLEGIEMLFLGSPTQRRKPSLAMQNLVNRIPVQNLKGPDLATFGVHPAMPEAVTGSAARAMGGRIRQRGGSLVAPPESFVTDAKANNLKNGEIERASSWARKVWKIHKTQHIYRKK
jgi:flavodoxin